MNYLLVTCVLNDESDIRLLGKLDTGKDIFRRSHIDRVIHEVSECARCRFRGIRTTTVALEIGKHDRGWIVKSNKSGLENLPNTSKQAYWYCGNAQFAERTAHSVAL